MSRQKLFNYYDFVNYYGNRMFAIAAEDAMPVSFNQILFTGTMEECKLRMDPPGLEGTVEKNNQIKVAS